MLSPLNPKLEEPINVKAVDVSFNVELAALLNTKDLVRLAVEPLIVLPATKELSTSPMLILFPRTKDLSPCATVWEAPKIKQSFKLDVPASVWF
jgi:hypothetical protein